MAYIIIFMLLCMTLIEIASAQEIKTETSTHIIYEPFHNEFGSIVHINYKIGLYTGINTGNVYGLEHTSYQLGLSYRFKTVYLLAGYHHHIYKGYTENIDMDKIHTKSVDIGIITRMNTICFIALTDILNHSTRIGIGINFDI